MDSRHGNTTGGGGALGGLGWGPSSSVVDIHSSKSCHVLRTHQHMTKVPGHSVALFLRFITFSDPLLKVQLFAVLSSGASAPSTSTELMSLVNKRALCRQGDPPTNDSPIEPWYFSSVVTNRK